MSSTPLRPTPSPTHAQIRTPLAKVRGLGSAKEGTDHFWKQRVSAVGTFLLVLFLIGLMVKLAGADYATVKKTLQKPAVSISLLLLILSGVYHMRLGMQMIIEDYVQGEGRKLLALMGNTFFSFLIAMICVFSVLKLAFGA